MFNLGWGEILLIGVVALIAIGPKELPGVLRTVGQMMGKVRRMANEFQGQFNEALREAELDGLKKHADDLSSTLNDTVGDLSQYDPLAETQKEVEKDLTLDEPAALPPPAEQAAADAATSEAEAPTLEKTVTEPAAADHEAAAPAPKKAGGEA